MTWKAADQVVVWRLEGVRARRLSLVEGQQGACVKPPGREFVRHATCRRNGVRYKEDDVKRRAQLVG